MCFLLPAGLKNFWDISSFPKIILSAGHVRGTFMQILHWTGGMIISLNPLETQSSIIIRYAPHVLSSQCSRLQPFNRTPFSLWISATQRHPTLRRTCASMIYPSHSFRRLYTLGRFSLTPSVLYLLNNFLYFLAVNQHWRFCATASLYLCVPKITGH